MLALLALPLLFFWPLFAPGGLRRWFPDGDFVDQFYAFARLETAALAEGRLPWWNPYAYAGAPFWADVQAAVAYPPSLLVVLAAAWTRGHLPFGWLQLEALLHIGLAAAFSYAFARRRLASRPGGLVAALVFAFGGYLTGYPLLQLAILETVAWLPLALLGVERQLARPGRRPDPLLALALGMAILAGHPQSALYLLYATLAWFAWRMAPRLRPAGAWRSAALRDPLLGFGGALGLGLALAAVGWLPALGFMRISNRAAADYAMLANGFPPRELLGLILPGLTRWSPLYVGVLPLLLALGALREAAAGPRGVAGSDEDGDGPAAVDRARRGDAWFWAGLVLLALLLSLGRHGFAFDLAYLVAPGFDLFRGQERAALLVSFGLAMLAGSGMAWWVEGRRAIPRTVIQGGLVLALLGGALAAAAPPGSPAAAAAPRLILLCVGGSLLAALAGAGRLGRRALVTGVLALIALDLYAANAGTNLVAEPPAELSPDPIVAMLAEIAPQRVQNDDRLPANFGVLHGVESTYGASPLRLASFEALYEGLRATDEARLWALLGVGAVVTWREGLDLPAEALLRLGEGEDAATLFRLEQPAPLAWRARAAERVTDEAGALARLREPGFDLFDRVLLHEGQGGGPAGTEGGLGEVVRAPGGIRLHTEGDAPAWVVVSEMAAPGWRATVDGAPAEVLRANLALMAVPVPAGSHRIELRYRDPWMPGGLAISLTALAILGWLAWTGRSAVDPAPAG